MTVHIVLKTKPRPKSGDLVKAICGKKMKFVEVDACVGVCGKCSSEFRRMEENGTVPKMLRYRSPIHYVTVFHGTITPFERSV